MNRDHVSLFIVLLSSFLILSCGDLSDINKESDSPLDDCEKYNCVDETNSDADNTALSDEFDEPNDEDVAGHENDEGNIIVAGEEDSYPDEDDLVVSGLEPLEYGSKNTFLVSMALDTTTSWKEMAFLATVPAGAKINNGKPSGLAVSSTDGLNEYHLNYLERYNPDKAFVIGDVSGYANTEKIDGSSLDEITCELARFWQKSDTVIMSDSGDYQRSLSASALAGRVKDPLFFFQGSTISDVTLNCLLDLGVTKVITVAAGSEIINTLQAEGMTVDAIKDEIEVITHLKERGRKVEYFATCNSFDRGYSYAPKSSLAAPMLAAARKGVVIPLKYASEFNTGCLLEDTTTTKPNGAADSADGIWRTGKCKINGQDYDVVISRQWEDFEHNQGNIDLNSNGNFGDSGEFIKRGQVRSFKNKKYHIDIDTRRLTGKFVKHWSDIRFTYPNYDEINNDLSPFYTALGHHPKYMAMVGLPDALPVGLVVDTNGKAVTHFTDQYYANADQDELFDIALGRILGEDASIFTMNASRAITYNELLDNSWKNKAVFYGNFLGESFKHQELFGNYGYNIHHIQDYKEVDPTQFNIFVHNDHGWPFDHGTLTVGPMAPGFVTTGGCSFGNIIDIVNYQGRLSEYKDFAAVKLAKTGAVGYNAFSRNATGHFDFGRDVFINALLNHGETLGEAQLRSINATKLKHNNTSMEITGIMLYGDPALKIHIPTNTPTYKPAEIIGNDSGFSAVAPESIFYITLESPPWNHEDWKYDYTGPGLSGGGYDKGKRFIGTLTTDKPVTNITQKNSVPNPLGWTNRFKVDEHPDGTRTIYLDVRFHEIDYINGVILQAETSIDYLMN